MKQETRNWWRSAERDFETARYNLVGERLDAAAFFAQQAAEKSLKSLQIEKLGRFERTHDLILLGKSVGAPREILGYCEMIGPFYTVTRYPDSTVAYDLKTVESVAEASEKVMAWTRRRLAKT